jgi:hypothetical protein
MEKCGKPVLDRLVKRHKGAVISWFCENCSESLSPTDLLLSDPPNVLPVPDFPVDVPPPPDPPFLRRVVASG